MLVIVCHSWLDSWRWGGHVTSDIVWSTLSEEWQLITNIECQVMSNRLWPTLGVKSQVTDYYQHMVSSDEWQTMTNITRHLTLNVGQILSLVTWHIMLVIVCHSWLDTRCWWYSVTRDLIPDVCHNLSLMTNIEWRVTAYYQHRVSSHEYQTMTNIGCKVTSDRLWPTSGVKSHVTDYDQHRATSHVDTQCGS
jgi:hypothetical protein